MAGRFVLCDMLRIRGTGRCDERPIYSKRDMPITLGSGDQVLNEWLEKAMVFMYWLFWCCLFVDKAEIIGKSLVIIMGKMLLLFFFSLLSLLCFISFCWWFGYQVPSLWQFADELLLAWDCG